MISEFGPERPQLLAGRRVVAADLRAVGDDHIAAVGRARDRRRAPRRDLVGARGLPELLAGGNVPCRDVRALLHVGLKDHGVAVDDRRARVAPLERRIEEPSAVERAEIDAPQLLAVEVPRDEHAGRSEHGDDAPAVSHRRRAGLTALGVPLRLRCRGDGGALPENLSGRLVERVDLPLMLGQVVHRLDVTVQAGPERVVAGLADRGDREHAIAPDHRARVGDAGNRRLPLDVLSARDVPLGDRALTVAVARRAVATKRGPVARTGRSRD